RNNRTAATNFISVIFDGTTDCAVVEQEAVFAIYFDPDPDLDDASANDGQEPKDTLIKNFPEGSLKPKRASAFQDLDVDAVSASQAMSKAKKQLDMNSLQKDFILKACYATLPGNMPTLLSILRITTEEFSSISSSPTITDSDTENDDTSGYSSLETLLARNSFQGFMERHFTPSFMIIFFQTFNITPLHLAVLTCQPSIVEYLMLHEADVNAIDRNGQTALHLACKNADVEDIHALRNITPKDSEKSINVDLKNFEGLAPIHLATLSGSCEVIEQLLEMGADVDLKDSKSGRTALHHAVEAHNPIVTRFLLLKDANVNAQTFAGNTPLHTASGRRMENIIHILLEFGGDRKLTNFE
ncbi:B-cell lymphoma 3, partial [Paramuricea clavata]